MVGGSEAPDRERRSLTREGWRPSGGLALGVRENPAPVGSDGTHIAEAEGRPVLVKPGGLCDVRPPADSRFNGIPLTTRIVPDNTKPYG